jgi:hypothetical protein
VQWRQNTKSRDASSLTYMSFIFPKRTAHRISCARCHSPYLSPVTHTFTLPTTSPSPTLKRQCHAVLPTSLSHTHRKTQTHTSPSTVDHSLRSVQRAASWV